VGSQTPNLNLESTLSVKTVLEDLKLPHLYPLFEKEEVENSLNYPLNFSNLQPTTLQIDLTVFFTLNESDLKTIGVKNEKYRMSILEFISDFSTPEKSKKTTSKKLQPRH
jgi:hypothetical protein